MGSGTWRYPVCVCSRIEGWEVECEADRNVMLQSAKCSCFYSCLWALFSHLMHSCGNNRHLAFTALSKTTVMKVQTNKSSICFSKCFEGISSLRLSLTLQLKVVKKPLWVEWCSLFSLSVIYGWLSVTPWTLAGQVPLSFTVSQSLLRFLYTESVMLPNHPVLCHPFLLLPSAFPSLRVFSNESALCNSNGA